MANTRLRSDAKGAKMSQNDPKGNLKQAKMRQNNPKKAETSQKET